MSEATKMVDAHEACKWYARALKAEVGVSGLQAENARLREALGEAHKSFAVLHGPISKLSDKDPYWKNAGKCIRKDMNAIERALGDTDK